MANETRPLAILIKVEAEFWEFNNKSSHLELHFVLIFNHMHQKLYSVKTEEPKFVAL